MEGKDARGTAHPTLGITIPQQRGGWTKETTTRGEEAFTRCAGTARLAIQLCELGHDGRAGLALPVAVDLADDPHAVALAIQPLSLSSAGRDRDVGLHSLGNGRGETRKGRWTSLTSGIADL